MAPEHLEALADGVADGVDARSDVYCPGRGPVRGAGQAAVPDARRHRCDRRGPAPRGRGAARRPAPLASRGAPRSPPRSTRWCAGAWPPTRPTATPRRPSWRPTSRRWPTTGRSASPASPSRAGRSAGFAATAAPWPWESPWHWPSRSASALSLDQGRPPPAEGPGQGWIDAAGQASDGGEFDKALPCAARPSCPGATASPSSPAGR